MYLYLNLFMQFSHHSQNQYRPLPNPLPVPRGRGDDVVYSSAYRYSIFKKI